jgi:hypothetical protein
MAFRGQPSQQDWHRNNQEASLVIIPPLNRSLENYFRRIVFLSIEVNKSTELFIVDYLGNCLIFRS